MPEAYLRGNTIKYIRVPDEVCARRELGVLGWALCSLGLRFPTLL